MKKIASNSGGQFVYALQLSRGLYTGTLKHRTQILYDPDISFVISQLDIRPGKKIVESGTGSGSLTFSLMRALGGRGALFSFEYNQTRAEAAQAEFSAMGAPNVHIFHRDAYKEGFIVPDKLAESEADAVFLDLPSPWLAVDQAQKVLKKGGR